MAIYALIQTGVVVQCEVIGTSDGSTPVLPDGWTDLTNAPGMPGAGATLVNGVWVLPAPTIAEQAMAIPSIAAWKIQVVLDQHPSPVNAGKTLLDDANALIATQPRAVQIAWTNGADVAYASPTLAALRAAIGITSDDAFDAMWVSAAAVAL